MTSVSIVNGANPTSRPTTIALGASGYGPSVLIEGWPDDVEILNAGPDLAITVQVDGDDTPIAGTVGELAAGDTLNIAKGELVRLVALTHAGTQLVLEWDPDGR